MYSNPIGCSKCTYVYPTEWLDGEGNCRRGHSKQLTLPVRLFLSKIIIILNVSRLFSFNFIYWIIYIYITACMANGELEQGKDQVQRPLSTLIHFIRDIFVLSKAGDLQTTLLKSQFVDWIKNSKREAYNRIERNPIFTKIPTQLMSYVNPLTLK